MVVKGLVPVPAPPPESSGKAPMLTAEVVWLIGLVFTLAAVLALVGHVDLLLAFGLPTMVVLAILGAIGIGRGANTVYRTVFAFLRRNDDGRGTSW